MSKGSRDRTRNRKAYAANYDRVFSPAQDAVGDREAKVRRAISVCTLCDVCVPNVVVCESRGLEPVWRGWRLVDYRESDPGMPPDLTVTCKGNLIYAESNGPEWGGVVQRTFRQDLINVQNTITETGK